METLVLPIASPREVEAIINYYRGKDEEKAFSTYIQPLIDKYGEDWIRYYSMVVLKVMINCIGRE